jgi:hypothetical protein
LIKNPKLPRALALDALECHTIGSNLSTRQEFARAELLHSSPFWAFQRQQSSATIGR